MFENNNEYLVSGILKKYVGTSSTAILPEGITEIADGAFENADVTEVVFSKTVEKVGDNAFRNCKALKRVVFGPSLKRFGYDAFTDCSSLEEIDYEGEVENWLEISFAGYTSNPAYYGELRLKGSPLHDLVLDCDEIPDYAFCGVKVDSLSFKRPLTRIGVGAFSDLDYDGVLDVDVKEIADLAFRGTKFSEIRLGRSLKRIESWAFFRCSTTKINYDGGVEEWLKVFIRDVWANPLYNADLYIGGVKTEDLVIPEGVEEIPDAAFAGVAIKSLTLPKSLKKIGEAAFYGCESLERVIGLRDEVNVHPDAFALCSNINK